MKSQQQPSQMDSAIVVVLLWFAIAVATFIGAEMLERNSQATPLAPIPDYWRSPSATP